MENQNLNFRIQWAGKCYDMTNIYIGNTQRSSLSNWCKCSNNYWNSLVCIPRVQFKLNYFQTNESVSFISNIRLKNHKKCPESLKCISTGVIKIITSYHIFVGKTRFRRKNGPNCNFAACANFLVGIFAVHGSLYEFILSIIIQSLS